MVTRLAAILRASIRSRTQFSPLSGELALVEDYMAIQKMRFGDKLAYTCSVPESLKLCTIPCMSIQPLIENAIQHGFSFPKQGNQINVTVWQEGEQLLISVRDNGIGMSPERLRDVLSPSRPEEESRLGIGLKNVMHRVRLLYGEGHVDIQTSPGKGTTIILHIPINGNHEEPAKRMDDSPI